MSTNVEHTRPTSFVGDGTSDPIRAWFVFAFHMNTLQEVPIRRNESPIEFRFARLAVKPILRQSA